MNCPAPAAAGTQDKPPRTEPKPPADGAKERSRGKDKESQALRLRENQRRSRLRKKEYLASLETRFRDCQRTGVEASIEVQEAAKRVVRENARLRQLLGSRGVSEKEIEVFLRYDGDGRGPVDRVEGPAVDGVARALGRRPCGGCGSERAGETAGFDERPRRRESVVSISSGSERDDPRACPTAEVQPALLRPTRLQPVQSNADVSPLSSATRRCPSLAPVSAVQTPVTTRGPAPSATPTSSVPSHPPSPPAAPPGLETPPAMSYNTPLSPLSLPPPAPPILAPHLFIPSPYDISPYQHHQYSADADVFFPSAQSQHVYGRRGAGDTTPCSVAASLLENCHGPSVGRALGRELCPEGIEIPGERIDGHECRVENGVLFGAMVGESI